jgi:hypothetical protein
MFLVKRLGRQLILTSLGARKPKGLNMITKSAKVTYALGSGKSKKDRQHNGQKKQDK